jgi:hypothetical protein
VTALSDALTAAQAKAITALERGYVAGLVDAETMTAQLDAIGCADVIERAQLLAALDVLREWGATAPAEPNGSRPPKPASEPQRRLIGRLADGRGFPAPDLAGVTSAHASEIITQLQNGTYDPERWALPFS